MLRQEAPQARRALPALLAGRLVFTPGEPNGEPAYTFAGEGTITPVIAGVVAATGVVSPTGFEPVLPD